MLRAGWVFIVLLQPASGLESPLRPAEEHYRLDVQFDAGALEGSGSVRLKNTTGKPLGGLALNWSGALEVTLGGRPVSLVGSPPEPLEFELPSPLAPGAATELHVHFRRPVSVPEPGRSVQFTNWHPRLWWGYETHAAYDVRIQAPPGVVVAASARFDPGAGRYRATQLRTFGIFLGGRGYEIADDRAGETVVRAVFLPSMQPCAALLLKTAVDVVNFYRQRFGFYPQPSLTILPGASRPMGGYPFATAMVVVHGQEVMPERPESHWRWITAHEIGHQYWSEHVLAKEPEQGLGWLMIGLGIWMDREYSRARGLTEIHPRDLDSYADAVRKGHNTTVELPPEQLRELKFDYNTQVTHNKGFGIVSALAAILGRETFDRIHARCLREYASRRLGSADFRRMAEEESGQDLGWFFVPLLRTSGYASYEIAGIEKSRTGDEHVARVRIRRAGLVRLPVPVEARFENGERRRLWTSRLRDEQTLEFRGKAPLAEAVIDPDREFPMVIPPPEASLPELTSRVEALPWTGAGAEALRLYERAAKLSATEPLVWGKLGLLLFDGRRYEAALDAFNRAAPLLKGRQASWHFTATVWQGMLLDLLGRREEALARYREALALGGDPSMRHDQYGLILNRAWVEERLKKPFTWQ